MLSFAIYETDWGSFGCVVHGDRLVATYLPASHRFILARIREEWPEAVEKKNLLPRLRKSVEAYFSGRAASFDVQLDLSHRTPFHRRVLQTCHRIPYGETASYGDLARAAGRPQAARAAGQAMAFNPIPLVVPCHRVLRSDGAVGGFTSPGGPKTKRRMLRLERDTLAQSAG